MPSVAARRADERVEIGRALAVGNPFRVSRRAARVAHRGGLSIVHFGPLVLGRLAREELLVRDGLPDRAESLQGGEVPFAHDDDPLDARALPHYAGEQARHGRVADDDLVRRMVDHVLELLGEEPDVEGVEDRAHARHGEVRLDMLLVVETEGPDTVARPDSEGREAVGQLCRSAPDLGERRPSELLPLEGHDLTRAVDLLAVTQDLADEQLRLLHRASHWLSLPNRESRPLPTVA